jgi:multiple sugar transport system substrate-binding protein
MNMPDDKTWTWDQLIEIGAEVASKAGVPFGVASLLQSDALFGTFVRQHGKELFTENGLGFDVPEAQAWYDYLLKGQKAKAFGTPEQVSEEQPKPLDQSAIVVGNAAMQYYNSNQLEAVSAAAGEQPKMLRGPSLAGKATERKTWYKASMLWSASSKSKNPDAAIAWINWFANTPDAANIDLAERGIPPNTEILAEVKPKLSSAQKVVAKYIEDIKPEVGETPIAPPPGGGTIQTVIFRHGIDVLFGKTSPADGAKQFVDEMKSNLKV